MLTLVEQALVFGVAVGAIYALAASGLGIIFGLFGIINFAHTQYLMLGAVAALALTQLGAPYALGIIGGIVVAGLVGAVTERLAIRPLVDRETAAIDTLFLTLGLAIVIENATLMLWGSEPQYFDSPFHGVIDVGGLILGFDRVFVIGTAVVVFAGLHILATRTRVGKAVLATAQNPVAARVIGIPVEKVRLAAFTLGCALAGLGGILWGTTYSVSYITGSNLLVISFVLVVMSGPGNISGILACSLILGVTESLAGTFFDPKWERFAVMLVFIFVIVRRPGGLFGAGRLARSNI